MGAEGQGATATHGRWLVIPRTLCFVVSGEEILLMKRAPHKRVFPNQYNGLGGHLERDEDPYSGAKREILEESGIDVDTLNLVAIHHIDTADANGILLFVFVGTTTQTQVVSDGAEGTLEWVKIDSLANYDLVEDLPMILPRYLQIPAQPHFVHVSYDAQDQIVMRYAEGKLD
jgi:8-oxo-dGTP diphosphatase